MRALIVVVLLLIAAAALAAYSGVYNVAADEPHWAVTERVLAFARERSIETRAGAVAAPGDLANEQRIITGAGQYEEMCQSCHLAPGVQDTELRKGLYPKPPDLAAERVEPRHAFWVIKHGIKATGMPAWGPTHDDDTLWSVVAFLQKLPELDAKGYRQLVGRTQQHTHGTRAHTH